MLIYIGAFTCSALFLWLATKNENKIKNTSYIVLSVVLPVILAAMRAENIGTDVQWYLKGCYNAAIRADNILVLLTVRSDIEPLFLLLVYVCAKIFKNIFVLQGMIQLLISVPMYYAIWKNKKETNPVYAVLIYYFIFYMNNLNIMRQSIAIAFSLLAIIHMKNSKYKLMICIQVIAIGFHYSAIVNVVFLLIYWMLKSNYRKQITKAIVIVLCMATLFYNQIIIFLSRSIPFFRERYLLQTYISGNHSLLMPELILYLVNFITVFIFNKSKVWNYYICIMSFMSLIGLFLVYNLGIIARITMYWNYYLIFSLPSFVGVIRKERGSKIIFNIAFMVCLITYWWYMFAYLGYTETVPYAFGV